MTYLLVLAGWVIGQLAYLVTRDPNSNHSPRAFSLKFWFEDNWIKATISLVLSLAMNFALQRIMVEGYQEWMALAIGIAPDTFFSFLKDKFNFAQPEQAGGFERRRPHA
jgi:hypothetical protein